MFAIHSVGGTFDTHTGFRHSVTVLEWAEWGGTSLSNETFETVRRTLPWFNTDSDVRGVVLLGSRVESDWLPRLQKLSTLELLSLHDRQLGPELGQLGNLPKLRHFSINSASAGCLVHAAPLHQVKSLSLWRPTREDLGFSALARHGGIRNVFFGECPYAGDFLEQLAALPALEELQFQWSGGITTEQFETLGRMTRLKALVFSGTRVLDDDAFEQISLLPNLKTLLTRRSLISISDRGFDALARMTALRELSFGVGELTPDKADALRRRMPGCEITAP